LSKNGKIEREKKDFFAMMEEEGELKIFSMSHTIDA
jgi:hypothetical protein